jgi:hypothetical protein
MRAHGFHKAAGCSLSAGYTLLELAIATTVSGALLSGVLTFGAALWSEQRANEFAERMAAIVSTLESLYPGTTSYDSLNLASAIRLGVMRNENVIANTGVAASSEVRHLYGQRLTLGGLAGAGLKGQAWGLHFAGLPAGSCMAIAQYALTLGDAVALVADANAAEPSSFADWKAITQANGVVAGFPAAYTLLKSRATAPVAPAAVATACGNVTGGGAGAFGLALVRTRLA